MKSHAQLLLLDLLKLKVTYENEVLDEVRQVLERGEEEFLTDTLKLLQRLHNHFPLPEQLKPKEKEVNPIEETGRPLPPLVEEIKQLLESRDVFPTVKHLRDYLKAQVPSTKAKDTKPIVIEKYLKFLSSKTDKDLKDVRQELLEKTKKDVKKFMEMAKSIVDARGRKN